MTHVIEIWANSTNNKKAYHLTCLPFDFVNGQKFNTPIFVVNANNCDIVLLPQSCLVEVTQTINVASTV